VAPSVAAGLTKVGVHRFRHVPRYGYRYHLGLQLKRREHHISRPPPGTDKSVPAEGKGQQARIRRC
jgi:hypothetical protein